MFLSRRGSGMSLSGRMSLESISLSQCVLLHTSFNQYLNEPLLSIKITVELPTMSSMLSP